MLSLQKKSVKSEYVSGPIEQTYIHITTTTLRIELS